MDVLRTWTFFYGLLSIAQATFSDGQLSLEARGAQLVCRLESAPPANCSLEWTAPGPLSRAPLALGETFSVLERGPPGVYTCTLDCGNASVSRAIRVAAAAAPPRRTPRPEPDGLCDEIYHCVGDDAATTTMAGIIALLVIIGISIFGCIVAVGQTRCGVCRRSQRPPELSPHAALAQRGRSSQQPPKYEDVVTGSPPPVCQLVFALPEEGPLSASPLSSSSSRLVPDEPWPLPSYLQVIREWAARGVLVNTDSLDRPPPAYADLPGAGQAEAEGAPTRAEEGEDTLGTREAGRGRLETVEEGCNLSSELSADHMALALAEVHSSCV